MPRDHHHTSSTEQFTLRDGRRMFVRRMRPDDALRLGRLAGRLSPQALRLRFFAAVRNDPTEQQLRRLVNVDFERTAAFVAQCVDDDEVRAVGRLAAESATTAEVAFIVEDAYQGQGIATELLHHLAAFARDREISVFTATVLAENHEMLDVFRGSGYPMATTLLGGTINVRLDIRDEPGRG